MRLFFFSILFLSVNLHSFAQEIKNDSVIYLKAIVKGEKSNERIRKIKTKGEELASTFEGGIKSRVCLVSGVPEGELQSVKLYFNNGLINLAKKSLKVEYKDTEIRLVMYEAGTGDLPGAALINKDVRFIVKASHKGALELDLSPLKIKTQGKFFIGIELLEDTGEYTPIVLKVVANNDGITYIRNTKNPDWNRDTNFPNQIKLELKIIQ